MNGAQIYGQIYAQIGAQIINLRNVAQIGQTI